VRDLADENFPGPNAWALDLRMAAQAEIGVGLDEHFAIDGAMRLVTHHASFAQRFVLENERLDLLTVALRAALVEPGHGQAAGRLENVGPMRVVTRGAGHAPFDDRMPLRQVKLGLRVQMTLKTHVRRFAGIDDELPAAASCLDMFAAGPVA